MIVGMEKVRILGPRSRLTDTLTTLQDTGTVHLSHPAVPPPLESLEPSPRQQRHERTVRAALEDVHETLARLDVDGAPSSQPVANPIESIPREVRLARRARRATLRLAGELRALEEERAHVEQLLEMLEAFAELEPEASAPDRRMVYLVLERDRRAALEEIEHELDEAIGGDYGIHTRTLPGAELAVIIAVPFSLAERIDALLPDTDLPELELPFDLQQVGPRAAAEETRRRLAIVDQRIEALEARRRRLAAWLRPGLERARAALHDWLIVSEALTRASVSEHLFALEGWLPEDQHDALVQALGRGVGPQILVETVGREQWSAPDVPVAISNPPIFRPFEVITRRLPSPRYGSLDPTPFVAVFFPLFFGLILGDVGYGALLAGLSALGWSRSRPGTTLRAVSQVAAACAAFAILFGLLFGELFGDLGHHWLGLHALAFSREEAVVPFLILAVSIGFVHVVLGLVLGALTGFRSEPRHSLGRGLTALMLVLTAGLLLAALNVLPSAFFRPAAVALLLSFPVLILLEGFVGPIELLSRVSNILSYARIMALGTASVMLATVANQMVGALGGAVVGVVFATLFHLVNFGIGIFSPTIHGLRLHFVEFFGTFYSPSDQVYEPLRHWHPADAPAPQSA